MQTQVAYTAGNWCCYRTDDARKRRFVGCRHRSPASAIAHSDYIARHDTPDATPRGAQNDGPTDGRVAPASVSAPPRAPHGVAGDTALTTGRPSWRPEVAAVGAPPALPVPADGLTPVRTPSTRPGLLSPSAGVGSRITQSEKAAT